MSRNIKKYVDLIQDYARKNYIECFRKAGGKFKYPYFVPGAAYSNQLWDWDSWLTDIALSEIADADITEYEKGCVLNFLDHADSEGRIPINIKADKESIFDLKPGVKVNIHKPCLAQHALFISERCNFDVSWLSDKLDALYNFIDWYEKNCYHEPTGLYFFIDDFAIGVDNDPCVFYRPNNSTASVYLNCLMYSELCAFSKLLDLFGKKADAQRYGKKAEMLKTAIRNECWDDRDGFYYSVDINLKPVDPNEWLHSGAPRHWNSILMRIGVWTGFMTMWNGIATKQQAARMVNEHYLNEKTFNAPYGVRSLSKAETRMYALISSGNPSCWLGPIWGNCNYMVFDGLLRYGYVDLAKTLAEKTVTLFGADLEKNGAFHEYYHPETGEGLRNKGFQSWNLLTYNMAEWLKSNSR